MHNEDRFRQVVGGSSSGKEFISKCKAGDDQRFYLSTEGYYFKYRPDRNDSRIIRATLYRVSNGEQVDDVRVSEGYDLPEKSHHDLINYFEARLDLKLIK